MNPNLLILFCYLCIFIFVLFFIFPVFFSCFVILLIFFQFLELIHFVFIPTCLEIKVFINMNFSLILC